MSIWKSDKDGLLLERREFIKLGTAGFAVTLTGCAGMATGSVESTQDATMDVPPEGGIQALDLHAHEPLLDPVSVEVENWQEPWTWRPEQWPGASLELNVVRNQNPGQSTSPGNPTPAVFSFNGISPGPTVRVRNDGELRIRIRNMMGLNEQQTQVGPAPDPFEFTNEVLMQICALAEAQVRGGDPANPRPCPPALFPEQLLQVVSINTVPGWDLHGHINGQHAAHTTNLHTHGLHVFPQQNPDQSHSDNVFLRIIPKADEQARLAKVGGVGPVLAAYEHVGELEYKVQLAFDRQGEILPHPPGTHWYHPHSHGATHDQVASGMAGFLIVEGDVDEAINSAMTGEPWPEPEFPSGPFDYRERLMFIQRVFNASRDFDAGQKRRKLRAPPAIAVNGAREPQIIRMRPGAVERWRILNGSVDGSGTKRFMVLDGHFVQRDERIWRVISGGVDNSKNRQLVPVSEQELESAKLDLQQLALDGITLVVEENGTARHEIRDLSTRNANTVNPFNRVPQPGESEMKSRLLAFESVFRDGDSLRRSFVRPNELYLTNANRADIFFKAPLNAAGKVFTVFAREAHIHTDNYQHTLQKQINDPENLPFRPLFDVISAYVHVDGEPVAGGDFDIQSLNRHLPPVPPILQPVSAEELRVPPEEARMTGVPAGSCRTRTISYSGTGGPDFPTIELPPGFAEQHADMENITWLSVKGVPVLMANLTRTMAINPEFDLAVNPEPGLPRKFCAHDPYRAQVLLDTAEEWVLYNCSGMLWSHTDLERFPQPGAYRDHYRCYPISRAEGQRRFHQDPEFRITVKGADHPFHIHVNPMWVLRIEVPDENGSLHNILPEPTWMDTVPIPRNGGRVVFRSRFEDFVGTWVHHCHILLHEDMGMMQVVECTDQAERVNYHVRQQPVSATMSTEQVNQVYPPPSLELMYRQNLSFIDPNELGYQVYPDFDFDVPKLT